MNIIIIKLLLTKQKKVQHQLLLLFLSIYNLVKILGMGLESSFCFEMRVVGKTRKEQITLVLKVI